jgi:hypothetical protein
LSSYLADLCEKDPALYKAAFKNEIAALFGSARDYRVETEDIDDQNARTLYLKDESASVSLRSLNVLKLSPNLSKDANRFIVSFYANHVPQYENISQSFISLDKEKEYLVIDVTKSILNKTTITKAAGFAFNDRTASLINKYVKIEKDNFKLPADDIIELAKAILNGASLFAIIKDEKTQIHKYAIEYNIRAVIKGYNPSVRINKCKLSAITANDLKELEKMNVEVGNISNEGEKQ